MPTRLPSAVHEVAFAAAYAGPVQNLGSVLHARNSCATDVADEP